MKRLTAFLLALSISLVFPSSVSAKTEKNASIKTKSNILMCMNTGDILSEENAYERAYPASVTKIMSILIFLEAIENEKISLNDTVAATENAVSKGGSQIWLEVGEKMSVNDLLKAVIISSANDACTLLGEYVAGSDSAFVDMMNKKAEVLELKNSHFENSTGLDDSVTNHYSCAYDLAVIACEVMKYDLVKKYSTVWLDSLRNGKTELNNTNKLVNTYDGITGLKTGTTSLAGFCLCATAEREGLGLVSVVLGAETSDDRFNKSVELLNYGFSNYKIQKISIDENKIKNVKVKNGKIKSIKPYVKTNGEILTSKNSKNPEYKYVFAEEIDAPVKKGDNLGKIVVFCDSKEISTINLVAGENVEKISFWYIFLLTLKNI